MRIPKHVYFCFAIAASLAVFAEQPGDPPQTSTFKAGFTERDITPSIGMEQPGGYGKAFHTQLHDPCKVRAAVYDDGQTRVALVGVDALIVPRQLVTLAREDIHRACGILPKDILISASHSHSSGPTGMIQPGEYDESPDWVKRLAYEKSSCANAEYLDLVRTQIVVAVTEADHSRVAVRSGFGRGREDKVSFNRRFHMRNGLTWTHPGQGNPDILEYAAPIDPEVGVIGTWNKQGKLLGCIVNFACHATTNPGGISANWICYLEKTIRGTFGPDTIVVFLQGACGDITQVDNLSPFANPAPEKWAQIVGGRVGAEAVKVLLTIAPQDQVRVAGRSEMLQIKRRVPQPDHVIAATQILQKEGQSPDSTEWIFAKETILLDALIKREPVAAVEVQAIQVGPAVFIANPSEYFVEFGLELKRKSPFAFTFPVELANGCVGYVPTEDAFGPHGGGYETRLTSYSNLEVTAGGEILKAGLHLARQLTPGPVPEMSKAPPFRQPWSYGNVSPQLD